MATPLEVRTARAYDGRTTVIAVGELDMSNVAVFAEAVAAANPGGAGSTLLIDLTEVDYLDSAAINVLFDHARTIELVVNPIVAPVLTHSGLADIVDVTSAR
ncbi:STAS domain-containing protein [Mycolicibacterium vaccae]|uniref:STAS domain-containing protein n=1 Tax=Mycolicibacterium vaccae TaxID=1810 RepID=UPI003D093E1F